MIILSAVLQNQVTILQSECEIAINWLYSNKLILNVDKFQVILLHKEIFDKKNIEVGVGNKKIRSTSSVKLLWVHINVKLDFNEHINKICKSAGKQLKALIRLKLFSGLKEKEFSQQLYILKF